MKTLIIGGTGNISTGIVRLLLERGEDVTLYNRGKTEVAFAGDYKTIIGDRTDYAAFEAQMAAAGTFDCVIDMIGFEVEEAHSIVRAFSGRAGRFIFCSTVDVYTKPALSYPLREGVERAPSPTFPYAYKKAQMEKVLERAHERGDLPLTIIRPAATYEDKREPIGLVGGGILQRIRQGKPLIVLGDGCVLWAFSHRDDVAPAFVGAMDNAETIGKAYHAAGEEIMTWQTYYATVARALGAPAPEFVHIPTDQLLKLAPKAAEWCGINFQYNNVFDNTAARADLGFRYTIPWERGARQMVEYHDARGQIDGYKAGPLCDKIVAEWKKLTSGIASLETT